MGAKADLWRAAERFFAGEIAPVVDRTFAMSEIAQAHRYLESSAHFGKVVLEMP
jgi:NADPH:quinone reductase-like Zn-dependent oxidoreductase